jgi:hypothetical protein
MDGKSYNIRVPKRWVRVAMIVGVTALIVAPLTAVATHSFDDVPNDNTFHEDIAWLKDAAVTLGCNPPDNDEFCPDENVTREQMAAFMRRLAENQVVDAATAVTAETAATAEEALEVANDVAGVALAGVQFTSDGTVTNWFNRFGGAPTVANPATGTYVITIPGLEGQLGARALVLATDLEAPANIVRQFNSGSTNTVELRVVTDAGAPANSHVNMTVMASNETAVAGVSDASGPDANE